MPTFITINSHEVKTKLIELLREIELHRAPVHICRNGKPIADKVPIEKITDPLKQHKQLKNIRINFDPTTSLDNEDWPDQGD